MGKDRWKKRIDTGEYQMPGFQDQTKRTMPWFSGRLNDLETIRKEALDEEVKRLYSAKKDYIHSNEFKTKLKWLHENVQWKGKERGMLGIRRMLSVKNIYFDLCYACCQRGKIIELEKEKGRFRYSREWWFFDGKDGLPSLDDPEFAFLDRSGN